MIEGSIQEEDITIVNIYTLNIVAPKYIKQIWTDIKGEIDSNTIIVGDFNTPLTSMDKSSRQKINKETLALKDTLDQIYLIDIYRTFHPKAAEYTLCCTEVLMEHFSKIDHILGYKTNPINLRNLKLYQASFLTRMVWN